MALPPTYVKGGSGRPVNPKAGGHYVPHQGGWQLIHAVGPGHWVPGPVGMRAPHGAPKGPSTANVNTGRFANPIFQPSKQLSGSDLYKAAVGLANAQTQGSLAELAQQIASNNTRSGLAQKAVSGYFGDLGNLAKQGVTDQQGVASGLNSQLQGIGQQETSQLQGFGQQGQQALSQYAPGGTAQAAQGQLTADMARQQGLAAQDQGAFKASGATQGAIGGQLAASNLGTFAKSGQESLGKIAQAGQLANLSLNAKMADVTAQKGALLATDLGKLRQQEIANRFTSQGLGLRQQGLAVTAANDQARNALTARGQNITAAHNAALANLDQQRINATIRGQDLNHWDRQTALAAKEAAQNLASGTGGAKPLATAKNDSMLAALGRIENAIHVMQRDGIWNKAHTKQLFTPQQLQGTTRIREALTGIDPLGGPLVTAAYELLGYGSIDQKTAAQLHAAGIRGGSYKNQPIKVTHNYTPPKPITQTGSLFGQPINF